MENKTICNKCKSTQTYIRLKTKERICRSCGDITKLENESNEETNKESN